MNEWARNIDATVAKQRIHKRYFHGQITPVALANGRMHAVDEGVRGDTTVGTLAQLKTLVEMGMAKAVPGGPAGV